MKVLKEGKRVIKSARRIVEEGNMKSFHFEFTVDGTKSSSNVNAVNMESAKKLVKDQYSGKNISFQVAKEITDSNAKDSVNEAFDDTLEETPMEEDFGVASMLHSLIIDEWEAIEGYNSAIATATQLGLDDIVQVLTHIQNEENKHVGELQACLQTVADSTKKIDIGTQEAEDELDSIDDDTDFKPSVGLLDVSGNGIMAISNPPSMGVDMPSAHGNPIDIEVKDYFDADDDM